MNIITHDWNGYGIAQLKQPMTIAKYDIPRHYVNATQMCKANGKQWKHYKELDSTAEYLDEVSRSVGLTTNQLIIEIKTGSNETRGTWVHPLIAIDVAQWISAAFRLWCNLTLLGFVSAESEPKSEQPKLPPMSYENQLRLLDLSKGFLDLRYDERLAMAASAMLKNMIEGVAAPSDEPKLLSATEWLGTLGYRPPTNKENWLGRKIAEAWREQRKCDPTTAPKYVGTNHQTEIKVYPEDFLPVIIEVTEDYCQVKLTQD
jgi:hypothetical protein